MALSSFSVICMLLICEYFLIKTANSATSPDSGENVWSTRIHEVTDALGQLMNDVTSDYSDSLTQCSTDSDEMRAEMANIRTSFEENRLEITGQIKDIANKVAQVVGNLTSELNAAHSAINQLEADVEQIRNVRSKLL